MTTEKAQRALDILNSFQERNHSEHTLCDSVSEAIDVAIEALKVSAFNSQDCKPSCKERYQTFLEVLEETTEQKMGKSRERMNVIMRYILSYQLRSEGYSYKEIGKTLGFDHSTIIYYYKKMKDIISLPKVFNEEMKLYTSFLERIDKDIIQS